MHWISIWLAALALFDSDRRPFVMRPVSFPSRERRRGDDELDDFAA